MFLRSILIALLALLMLRAPAAAQELTRADSADVLVGTAERLRTQGADDLAEAIARMVARRYADTPAAARATTLLAGLQATQRSGAGRVGLTAFSTIYGAWLGVAVPLMFEADGPEAYGIGLLAGAPLGFFAGRAWSRAHSISAGDAGLITWSGAWGTWQGAGWMIVLGDGLTCDGDICYDDGPDGSETVGASVAGGLLGIGASLLATSRTDVSGGTATMIGWGSLWGMGAGVVTAVVMDMEDDDEPLAASLIGGDLGFAAMAVLAPRWDMSAGRAWLVNAAGIMGGAIGAGIDLLIQPEDSDVAILIPAVGSAIGLGLGAHLTRDYDEGRMREGMLHDPAAPAGALVHVRDGEWRVAAPLPAPVLLREDGRRGAEPGLRVQLLDARF